jgi:hypothetical protein
MFEMIDEEKPDQERNELLRNKVVAFLVAFVVVAGAVSFFAFIALK